MFINVEADFAAIMNSRNNKKDGSQSLQGCPQELPWKASK